jgi:coenzyme F420-reducing hydrogenase beta subunit
MVTNSEGFLYPEVNESKCINCNRCRDICPILTRMPSSFQRTDKPETYACWINDEKIRRQSSSGGLFTAIAMSVLEDGGIVFGAAFDENMHLHHIGAEDIDGLEKLRRSKYVQSEIDDSYKSVKDFLKQEKRVLFVGAPCQVAGLNAYLGKDYDNLITIEFICHGVPSPRVFSEYIKYIEEIYTCRIEDINFRDKRKGWSNGVFVMAKFDNGKEVMLSGRRNGYFYGFLVNYFLRTSCYDCSFRTMPRQGDFTIADFWGIESKYPNEAHKGISCLIVNSSKGKRNIDYWKSKVNLFVESFSIVREKNKNLLSSIKMPIEREHFFADFNKLPFLNIMRRYLTPPLSNRVRNYIKCRLNLQAILFIKKWMNFRKI